MERVETGPIQFEDDWPGIFIRGDNAAYYAMMLASLIKTHRDPDNFLQIAVCESLIRIFESCNVRDENYDPELVQKIVRQPNEVA